MPYKRRYRPRRRRYARKAWYNKKYSVSQMARSALKGVSYLKGLVNSEMYKDTTSVTETPNNSGVIVLFNGVAQGDSDLQRTGNSIFIRKINAKLYLAKHASATLTSCRIMILCDNQQVGDTAPAVLDVLSAASPNAFLNTDTVGRFSILYSKRFLLNADRPQALLDYNKVVRMHTRFNGTAATDIQKCGLYYLMISNEPTNTPTISGYFRIAYHDN